LIMGGDNLRNLHKWKNADVLVKNYPIYVYPRIPGTIENTTGTPPVLTFEGSQNIQKIEAPIMQLSSTFIRRAIKEGKDIRPMLPEAVWRYVDEMHFYR
ncbi:MAG: nicotinate-nicotinamide nucleotide adenylyltransferase, partial [Marinirhabdus sp.]